VTQVVGFAAGRMPNMQLATMHYDGSSQPSTKRIMSDTAIPSVTSRFHEGSLDGMSNPPLSPTSPGSPMGSPSISPGRTTAYDEIRNGQNGSGVKNTSPTKAKLEQIAGKVGIKAVTASPPRRSNSQAMEPVSPTGKRRWRDVWRGSKPKDTN
jgi:hypothetical protein